MNKITVTVKPPREENYIAVLAGQTAELVVSDDTLSGYRISPGWTAWPAALRIIPIPEEVTTLDQRALAQWEGLKHVQFRHGTYQMSAGVFANCTDLETVVLGEGTWKIPLETFRGCANLRSVRLPDSVRRIRMDAFRDCSSLRSIQLPEGLEAIEDSAFMGCGALEEICLPDSVTELGEDAFSGCTALKKVRLSPALESIGSCAFLNCVSLEEIEIPPRLRKLPMGVFAGCKNLKKVVLPPDLKDIDAYAFYNCGCQDASAAAPRLPMGLLNRFAGPVPGAMLAAMGYHRFDIDRSYRIFPTANPGVFEVRSQYETPKGFLNDRYLMDEDLEPIPGEKPEIGFPEGRQPPRTVRNIVIVGGEETGKTTLANALLGKDEFPQADEYIALPTTRADSRMLTRYDQVTDTPGYSLLWNTIHEDTLDAVSGADTLIVLLSEELAEEELDIPSADPEWEERRSEEADLLRKLLAHTKSRDIYFVIPYNTKDWPGGQVPLSQGLRLARERFSGFTSHGTDGFFCIDPMKALVAELELNQEALEESGILPLKARLIPEGGQNE